MEIRFTCIRFRYSSLHSFLLIFSSFKTNLLYNQIRASHEINFQGILWYSRAPHGSLSHLCKFLFNPSVSFVSLISTLVQQCLTIKSMTNTIIMLEANSSKINLVNLNSPWPWKNHFPWEEGKKINKDSLTWNEQTSLARKPNARNITTNT